MEAITLGMLKTTGTVDLDKIDSVTVDERMNEQTEAIIIGRMKSEHLYELQKKSVIGQILTVGSSPDIQNDSVFRGFIEAITIEESTGRVKILCKGAECLIHKEKKSCSFQDSGLTYRDIMKATIRERGILKYQEKEDVHPFGPVIRYHETDWEFIRRMAACMGSVIYPLSNTTKPAIAIGIPDKKAIDIESVLEEKRQINRLEYLRGRKNDEILWELSSYQNLQLGSKISYYNDTWYIIEKKIRSSRFAVIFDYKLGKLHSCALRRYGALIPGCSIRGRVLEVRNEKIKMHLDIDREQNMKTAYLYPYKPETGNIMYSMPEKGEYAELYFPNEFEENAFIIHGRKTEENCKNITKFLRTPYGKSLNIHPDRMELASVEEENWSAVRTGDRSGVSLTASCKVKLSAKGKVRLSGQESIMLTGGSHISLIQNETMNQIVLSGNDIISYAEKYRMIPLRRFKKVESKERMPDPVFQSIENNLQLMGSVSPGYSDVLQQYAAAAVPVCTYPGNPQVENGIGIYAGRSM
ncbi:hypothetical protein D3Z50_03535 [Clostridiaceae bacterium]|nr:hypothetical protein [Clostridiaceae bacterium]